MSVGAVRLLPLLAAVQSAAAPQSVPAPPDTALPAAAVPNATALAAARARAPALLVRALLQARADDVAAAVRDCQDAAAACPDAAERFVLLQLAVELAAGRGAAQTALEAFAVLAAAFAMDRPPALRALAGRLAAAPATAPMALALADLQLAEQAARSGAPALATELGADAAAAAGRANDRWLAAYVATRCRELTTPAAPADPGAAAGSRPLATLAERALAMARDAAPERRPALLRQCAQWQRAAWWEPGADRPALAAQLLALTEQLCTGAGVTRLRFRDAADLAQLAIAGGEWRVEQGLLVGTGEGNRAYATHRLAFRSIDAVVIRGGIRSAANHNFRLAVGSLNVLFNWELMDQNQFVVAGAVAVTTPRRLVQGREHTVVVRQVGAPPGRGGNGHVVVLVDDAPVHEFAGALAGTVCVYPALGSEIFVREILVDGVPAAAAPVSLPQGALR